MVIDLLRDSAGVAMYAVIGLLLMMAGFFIVDLLTPGKLRTLLWEERSKNAALLVGSKALGVSIIVCAAIYASAHDLLAGLVSTLVYGVMGIVVMAVSFLLIDLFTPGKLGDLVHDPELHPATWVSAATHLGVALIIIVALL